MQRLIDATLSVAYIVLAFVTFQAQVYWEPWFPATLFLCGGIRAGMDAFGNDDR